MKKPTQKEIIIKMLQEQPNRKFFSYELTKIATRHGYIGSSGDRRARELAEKGTLLKERYGK